MPSKTKNRYSPWSSDVIQAVADVVASADWPGLTNSEITRLLGIVRIPNGEAL